MKNFLIKSLMVGLMFAVPLMYSTATQASSAQEFQDQNQNNTSVPVGASAIKEETPRFTPVLNAGSADLDKVESATGNLNRNFDAFKNINEEWESHNPHANKSEQDLKFEIESHKANLKSLQNEFANLSDPDAIKSAWGHILALTNEIELLKQYLSDAPARDQQRATQAQQDLEAQMQNFVKTGVVKK